jgi:hypothetical protein
MTKRTVGIKHYRGEEKWLVEGRGEDTNSEDIDCAELERWCRIKSNGG